MRTLKWSVVACRRWDELGFDAPLPPEWTRFETDFMARYAQAKDDARRHLAAGKRAEVVRLLNSAAEEIWKEAAVLLRIP